MKLGKYFTKKLAPLVLAGAMLFSPLSKSKACTGTKQISMGGAGITVCDNSHATYWNQAMLPNLENSEVSYTKAISGEENTKYDDIVAVAIPLKSKNMGVGLHLSNSDKKTSESHEKTQWIKFAAGVKLTDREKTRWNHSIGGAITPKVMELEKEGKTTKGNRANYEISYLAEKQDCFSKDDTLRAGFLLKGIETLNGIVGNSRPGISYTSQNSLGESTVSFSYYGLDALLGLKDKGDAHGPRIGIEQKLGDKILLRAGFGDVSRKVFSTGLGFEGKRLGLGVSASFYDGSKEPYGLAEISLKF